MALLGLLVVDQGRTLSAGILNVLLLANPTDVYRMFNLAGSANVSLFSGMAGVAEAMTLGPVLLLAALAIWAVLPLGLAALAFSRREL
jgi:Cu-processing system permease protein